MSNIERPTRDFETSGGYKIKILNYITGEENRKIRVATKKGEGLAGEALATAEFEVDDMVFDLVVVSVEGENLPEGTVSQRVVKMPLVDFKEVVAAVNEVVYPAKKN